MYAVVSVVGASIFMLGLKRDVVGRNEMLRGRTCNLRSICERVRCVFNVACAINALVVTSFPCCAVEVRKNGAGHASRVFEVGANFF